MSVRFAGRGVALAPARTPLVIPSAPSVPMYPVDSVLHPIYGDHFAAGPLDAKWTYYGSGGNTNTFLTSLSLLEVLFPGTVVHQFYQNAPAGDFSIVMKMQQNANTMVGPLIINSSGNGVGASAYNDNNSYAWNLNAYQYASTGPSVGDIGNIASTGCTHWLELKKTGTLYKMRISLDGFTWSAFSSTINWAGTPNRIGFGKIYGTPIAKMWVDYFNVI